MAIIEIEPYSSEELARTLPTISDQINSTYDGQLEDNTSVLSRKIFSYTDDLGQKKGEIERTEKFSKMGVINLPIGVLNPLLGGKGQIWGLALGIRPKDVLAIAGGELVYDKITGDLVKPSEVSQIDDSKYSVGGQALLDMLDKRIENNDIEKSLKAAIVNKFIWKFVKRSGDDGQSKDLYIDMLYENGPEEDHIFGKWYFPYNKVGLTKGKVISYNKGIEFRNELLESETLKNIIADEDDEDVYYEEGAEAYFYYEEVDSDSSSNEDSTDDTFEQSGPLDNDLASTIAGLGVELGSDMSELENESISAEETEDFDDTKEDYKQTTKKNKSAMLSQYENITILEVLATKAGIRRLKRTIIKNLPVIPYGYRTTFTGKNSTYTVLYDTIYSKAKNDLMYQRSFPEDFCAIYGYIYRMIKTLFVGDVSTERALRLKNHKPFVSSLSGKKGKIRLYTEGGRFDYTGRSVIVSSPDMPIDTVGVPLEIVAAIFLPKLSKRFLKHLEMMQSSGKIKAEKERNIHKTINNNYSEYLKWIQHNAKTLQKGLYAYIGRQPSLHYLSIQPYRVRILDGDDTLVLSPTIVEPFNADFDGDQMHISSVLTEEAIAEIKSKELLYQQPKRKPNGSIGSKPRLEMIYGLYVAFNAGSISSYKSYSIEEIHKKLAEGKADRYVSVNETLMQALSVSIINAEDHVNGAPASLQALNYILNQKKTGSLSSSEIETYFGKKEVNVSAIINTFASKDKDLIVECYSNLVRFTYGIAKRHLINASITNKYPELKDFVVNEVEDFNQRMYDMKRSVDLGLMSIEAYDRKYGSEWSKIQKKIDDKLLQVIPEDNGYRLMKETGAKGSKDTIRQIYGVKGQIEQVLDRPFGCIIDNSYANKLTGMQHFCTAYGARKGISDKVLATSKPGYLARKLNHAGATIKISKEDCGTCSGLDYNILDIAPLLDEVNQRLSWYFWTQEEYTRASNNAEYRVAYATCKDRMAEMLVGRNCIINGVTVFIPNTSKGIDILDNVWGKDFPKLLKPIVNGVVEYRPIVVRSPITCECPCCQTCYGFDWTLNKQKPEIYKKIGFIAAQAISEPGTQMTMKNFQRAGVVTGANLTSAFDIIEAYFDLRGRTSASKIPYDFVSPVDGIIDTVAQVGYNRLLIKPIKNVKECAEDIAKGDFSSVKLGGNVVLSNIYIDSSIELKRVVHRGEPVQVFCGNIDVKQALSSWSCLKVAKYLTLKLTQIYNKSEVKSIYIETILAGMLLGRILKDVTISVDGSKITYPAGSTISRSLLSYATTDISDVEIQWFLVGIKQLPKYKPDSMESLIMESLSTYLPRAAVIQPFDSGLNPISTLLMGQEGFGGEK